MEKLLKDVRYAIRTLTKVPGFTAVIVVSIALGFAANATIFSVANGLLWGVLPVKDPGRVVMFSEGKSFSYPDYMDYREQTADVFEGGVAAHFPLVPASVGGRGEPERVWGQVVSGNYFPILDAKMALGRAILPEEDRVVGRDHVVVISHSLWQRRFGADPGVVGRNVALNGRSYTVVGVTPAGFYGTDRGLVSEFWAPLAVAEDLMPEMRDDLVARTKRDNQWLTLNARLKPGVSRAQAAAAVNVVRQRLDDAYRKEEKRHRAMTLQTAGGLIAGSATPAFTLMSVLMVVAGLVLLVACANVANLLLARAAGRQKEIAIRMAMGASRRQVVRQLLTESLLLSLAGAAAGFPLAAVAARAISAFELPLPLPIAFDFNVDLRVAAFTLGLSLVTALVFGLAPALRATRPDLVEGLKDRPAWGRSRRWSLRNGLVVAQVALSLVLLATAGLFLRSLGNASSIDIGFRPENMLTLSVDPRIHNYSRERTAQFFTQLRERVAALPGVRSVSFTDMPQLSLAHTSYDYEADGQKAHANAYSVASGYFETMGMPLVSGRDFPPQHDGQSAAIINQTMAARLFAGRDAVGRTIRHGETVYTVIGVARNSKSQTLGEEPVNCVYLPLMAAPETAGSFFGITALVKTSVEPRRLARPVREQIAALDPNMAVFNTGTMQEHVNKALLLPRLSALLLGLFGAVGLTLAAVGLYGVMSYSVRRRTREVGIRIALGARPGAVLGMVLRQGLTLTVTGLAIGLGAALALGRFTASALYGVSGTDAATFAAVSAVLIAAAVAAIVVPARRAARIEPTTALRCE